MFKKVFCLVLLLAIIPVLVFGQTVNPTPTPTRTATPTIGIPYHIIPGTVEAEQPWQGYDTTAGNAGSVSIPFCPDVDVEPCSEGGSNVGWIVAGEWLSYNLLSKSPGIYDIEVRVARQPSGDSSMHIEGLNQDGTGPMTVPSTGGWQNWVTIERPGIEIGYGVRAMKVVMDGSDFNINWVRLTQTAAYKKLTLIKEGLAANQAIVSLNPPGLLGDQVEDHWYPEGAVVEIRIALPTPTPCDCPHPYFAGFTGDPVESGSNGIYTITMDADKIVYARFDLTDGSPSPTPTLTPTEFVYTSTPTPSPTPTGPDYEPYYGGSVTDSLSGPGTSRTYMVILPTDCFLKTLKLDCGNNNFDLYIKSDGVPTLTSYSACSLNPAGEVLDYIPMGVTTYFRVYCVSGSGEYTLSCSTVMGPTQIPTPTTPGTMPTPVSILPGTIESEDYDRYMDMTAGNAGGAYRNDDVDIEACSEGGYNVGWIDDAEWLEYDTRIEPTLRRANFEARVAALDGTSSFHLEIDDINITGPIPVPATGGWQTWASVKVPGLYLPIENHRIKTVFDNGMFNIDSCTFSDVVEWIPYTLTAGQVSISYGFSDTTEVTVSVAFPDAGYRITDWGTIATGMGTPYTVNINAEKYTGASAQVVTTLSHSYSIPALQCGDSGTFRVYSYGALVKEIVIQPCTYTPTTTPTPTSTPPEDWVPYVLSPNEVAITYTLSDVTTVRVDLTLPTSGFRIVDWGEVMIGTGTMYGADINIEAFTGAAYTIITEFSHTYTLPKITGTAAFRLYTHGTFVEELAIQGYTPTPTPTPTSTPTGYYKVTVTAPPATQITATSARIGGRVDLELIGEEPPMGAPDAYVTIRYWEIAAPTEVIVAFQTTTFPLRAGDYYAAITGLKPNREYMFEVHAMLASASNTFWTLPLPAGKTIPGKVEAEEYDGYYDKTTGNAGGAYRTDDVDLEACSLGGYNVGWIDTGEWLSYNVVVMSSGTYTYIMNVARQPSGSSSCHMEIDGVNATGTIAIPSTGGWQTWTNIAGSIPLSAGSHVIKVVMDGSLFNINYMEFQM
ncbi:MAG: carbohydrate-binding protein [Spirochaetales bacterium]|nr:carbohydrate-binding protein [Spirochaetales bacterium]